MSSESIKKVVGGSPAVRRLHHIRELDGIRGIAALAVFFHHLCFASMARPQESGIRLALYHVSHFGQYGVDLFFVLSGFLITSLLIEDRTRPAYYVNFYWKRALRILPIYVLCLTAVLSFIPHSAGYVVLSLLFLANFARLFHIGVAGPFWTLAIEEQFYLIWPTVVRRRSVDELSRWAIGIFAGAILLRTIAACFGHHDYIFTFFHCDGLAAGALLACVFEKRERTGVLGNMRWLGGAFIVGLALFLVSQFFTPQGGAPESFSADALQTGVTLLVAAMAGFVILQRGKPAMAIFRSRILTFFGLISYAMYMVHAYLMGVYDAYSPFDVSASLAAYWLRLTVVMAATILLCLVVRYAVELPAHSLRKYVLKRPAPETGPDQNH
ncbi:MAG TPA: acyltransferase [Acidobacteriaceae bacterium]